MTGQPLTKQNAVVAGVPALRTAAGCAWLTGLGFGIPGAYAMWHFGRTGEIATVLGYPTYGKGLFETQLGVMTSLPLLSAFTAVCAAECAAGWLLWRRHRSGGVLALGLLPVETAFWLGFSLPFGPLLGAVRTAVLIFGWPALHRPKTTTSSIDGLA